MNEAQRIAEDLSNIRQAAPLILSVTNYVVTNTTANALLALGASPAMSHSVEEMGEFARVSGAVVLNMGTLADSWSPAMMEAGRAANSAGIPVVFDPVAAGASTLRRQTATTLLAEIRPAVIRGNSSEILTLAGHDHSGRGVDALDDTETAAQAAAELAKKHGCVVCASGDVDLITDGAAFVRIRNGHSLMPRVTGLGCTATAICGAFAAVQEDFLQATISAMTVMGIAGEMAAEKSDGPGTLQLHLYDALYNVGPEEIAERLRLERTPA